MSGSSSPDGDAAADKRTLIIAGVVTFALVVVGVGTAAVFTRSACDRLAPDPVGVGLAGDAAAAEAVLADAFPDADAAARQGMSAAFATLADEFGPLTGIAEVAEAERLAATDGGLAALGPRATLLTLDGAAARAAVDLGDGRVVGSGAMLYSLAVGNDLTGQIDAMVPLTSASGAGLEAGTCVDTALINTPLAFHLDANGGEVVLLRVDEDGSLPELQLRDPIIGERWAARVEVGIAQPGVLGERLTAALGPELAVLGRRTAPDDDAPVLTAVERADGTIRWTVGRDGFAELLEADLPQRVGVLDAAVGSVAVVLHPDLDGDDGDAATTEEAATGVARLVVVDAADGARRFDVAFEPGEIVQEATITDDLVWAVITDSAGETRVVALDVDGQPQLDAGAPGEHGELAVLDDGRAALVTASGVVVVDPDEGSELIGSDLVGRDIVDHEGGVSLLFDGPGAEGGSIVVTFSGR